MQNREQYKRLVLFLTSATIIALQTAIFAFVWYTFYADNDAVIMVPFFRRGNYVIIGLYALMLFLFHKVYGGFKVGYLRIFEVYWSQILSVLCVNAIIYLQLCLIGRWKFLSNIAPIGFMTVLDLVAVTGWVFLSRYLYVRVFPPQKLLLVYGKYDPSDLITKMHSRKDKYNIAKAIPCSAETDVIEETILAHDGVILLDIPAERRNELLKFCFLHNVQCYGVPKISDILIQNAEDIHLFDTSLLLCKNYGLSIEQRILKRTFDIAVSSVLLLVASPFLAIIAAWIRLYDGGPAIFTQERLTKDGHVFKLYKFRSMRVQQPGGEYVMTRKDDDRITPVGRIIRRIHVDELPQLINILKGDMSFVGPRPECPPVADQYCRDIPEFAFRLKVKAGLTGYAQVYGKYNTTPYDKLKLDLTYIASYSFLLDIKLVMLTFKVLFQRENTEGIEAWQTTAAASVPIEEEIKSADEAV